MELHEIAGIFEQVKVAGLQPDDYVVFRTPLQLDVLAMAQLHEYLEKVLGTSRILILDGGADLAIVRPEMPAAEPDGTQRDAAGREILPNGQPKRGSAPGAIA
jgi:hypothetical protein